MNKKQKKFFWEFWWEQVLKGVIPECVYRMAKIRESLRQLKQVEERN